MYLFYTDLLHSSSTEEAALKVGFIGVGSMGAPMAEHLQSAGHELRLVRNRSPLPPQLLINGAVECGTPAELAGQSDIVILMLPETIDVAKVLFGEDGVSAGIVPGTIVVDMSSIDPFETREFARRIIALGGRYADAPVSGCVAGARKRALTIMVGTEEDVFARIRPLLECMGSLITLVGPVGTGQAAKVASQIIVTSTLEAATGAISFAVKAGADPAKVLALLLGGIASSRVLEINGQRLIDQIFKTVSVLGTGRENSCS